VKAKACIRSYSYLQIKDSLASRFTQLRESGLSVDEAWNVIAVETLADAGLVEPEPLQKARVHTGSKPGQIPVLEAKLVTTIRIEPADDDRIKTLLARARQEAALSKADDPDQSSIIRQALRLGMDELERRSIRK
jgi:hypothetical protein